MGNKKTNNNKSGKARAHKEQLRLEAEERQNARNKRSALQQLQLIADRPGNSKRESEKLLTLVA